ADGPCKNGDGSVEVYGDGRYFTITSNRINDHQVEERQQQFDRICTEYLARPVQRKSADVKPTGDDSALDYMLRIQPKANENDGSKPLYSVVCRAVEYDLSDDDAIATIRQYEEACPFPVKYSDDEICRRLRDAEKIVTRGIARPLRNYKLVVVV